MIKADIGVYGLAVMGENLSLNIADKGFVVAVYNRSQEDHTKKFAHGRAQKMEKIIPCYTIEKFIASIARPRKILLMIQAGSPVDEVLEQITPLMDIGDIVIDSGNTNFQDSIRRNKELNDKGFLYVGAGVSGGEEGALNGPAITPGGNNDAYAQVEPILTRISAQVDNEPCCAYIGSDGAGHYVKMVHNGIEYGTMQIVCEAYWLMKTVLEMDMDDIIHTFEEWDREILDSYVLATTITILSRKDPETDNPLVDMILDKAGQKGTGLWTSQSALELHVPAPTIAAGVFARAISEKKDEREKAASIFADPHVRYSGDKEEFLLMLRDALYASTISSYAQGFDLMTHAAQRYDWQLDLPRIARIWRGGCILQVRFLDRISDAFINNHKLPNLLVDPYFTGIMKGCRKRWRKLVSTAVTLGVPIPAISASLSYFDSYRSALLPSNLIQAQRDCFGKHLFERTDRPGQFHFEWLEGKSDKDIHV